MKIKLTEIELVDIVKSHLISMGFESDEVKMMFIDKKEYEYYGNPTNQDRKEIVVKHFDGIEANIVFNANL